MMLQHQLEPHLREEHGYPRCAFPACLAPAFTNLHNHELHVVACAAEVPEQCPFVVRECVFVGRPDEVVEHLTREHCGHFPSLVPDPEARYAPSDELLHAAFTCSGCAAEPFGSLKLFSKHMRQCFTVPSARKRKAFGCDRCGLRWSNVILGGVHLCSDVTRLTPAEFLSACAVPFYTMVKGAHTSSTVRYGAELALSRARETGAGAGVGAGAGLAVGPENVVEMYANVAFESPALSLLPLKDLDRTRLGVFLSPRPAQFIWVMLVAILEENIHAMASSGGTDGRSSHHAALALKFDETLRTVFIPASISTIYGEQNLRRRRFYDQKSLAALTDVTSHEELVYYVRGRNSAGAPGHVRTAPKIQRKSELAQPRLLKNLLAELHYASDQCARETPDPEHYQLMLHTGLIPAAKTDAGVPDLHAIMKRRSKGNEPREFDQMAAVYEFFKAFGDLWYEVFGCFFVVHDRADDEDLSGTQNAKWTVEHMQRTCDALDRFSINDVHVLPRNILAEGWMVSSRSAARASFETRQFSFMEIMRLEVMREETVGGTYARNGLSPALSRTSWLNSEPLVPPQSRGDPKRLRR
jgi:hypothetical protein